MQYSIFIADDNQEWCETLKQQFESTGEFLVLPPANEGEVAIAAIERDRPDIVLLDLIMPGFDGLYIVNHIRENIDDYNPFIYVVSGIGTQRTNQILRYLEVTYYSIKPIKAMAVVKNVQRLIAHLHSPEYDTLPEEELEATEYSTALQLDLLIDEFLMELGASISLISTKCTRIAIKKIILEEKRISGTMCLYRLVAEEFNPQVSVSSVERNVRSTLSSIKKRDSLLFQKCFAEAGGAITNANFLYTCAHILKQRIKQSSHTR